MLCELAAKLPEHLQLEGAGVGIVNGKLDADVGKPDMGQVERLTTNKRRDGDSARRKAA
jgi:hypothetical protein